MAQLIVRNIEAAVVKRLRRAAAEHGVSAEEEHRSILRDALSPRRAKAPDLKALLTSIPTGDDVFVRERDTGRSVEL